jgi:hypothetical protein
MLLAAVVVVVVVRILFLAHRTCPICFVGRGEDKKVQQRVALVHACATAGEAGRVPAMIHDVCIQGATSSRAAVPAGTDAYLLICFLPATMVQVLRWGSAAICCMNGSGKFHSRCCSGMHLSPSMHLLGACMALNWCGAGVGVGKNVHGECMG